MRPEWPGDGDRQMPEPPHNPWPGYDTGPTRTPRPGYDTGPTRTPRPGYDTGPTRTPRPGYDTGPTRAPRPPEDQWSGAPAWHAPEPQRDHWAGSAAPGDSRGVGQANLVAIASLLCAIALILDLIGRLGSLLLAIPAVICGGIALWQIRNRGGRGQGMAIGGLIVGVIGILIFVVVGG